ncbi:hypothetical protein BHM03_00016928 [Ensete ventricosum]|uniref:Uncharacterized protein n=1 Tax=Ensete ventricosum TaxID=4639 RepID=A0A445MET3_ENSVE|nr:hypothetical protein BHM03_00016928 [Ensete ventricosum]
MAENKRITAEKLAFEKSDPRTWQQRRDIDEEEKPNSGVDEGAITDDAPAASRRTRQAAEEERAPFEMGRSSLMSSYSRLGPDPTMARPNRPIIT